MVVTGAGGFVGRHLVAALGGAGHEVIPWVRREIPGAFVVDLARVDSVKFDGVDAVVHSAGVTPFAVGAGGNISGLFFEGNTAVTSALAKAVAASEVRFFVHLSSIAAAGFTGYSSGRGLSEDEAIEPAGSYGKSKFLAEGPVEELRFAGKMGVNLRLPLLYGDGAGGNWRRLVRLARSPLPLPFGAVKNRRSFCGIENLTDLVLTILARGDEPARSGTYHVADAEVVSLSEVIGVLRSAYGEKAGMFSFPPAIIQKLFKVAGRGSAGEGLFGDLVINSARVCETFSWSPAVETLEGMRRSVARAGS